MCASKTLPKNPFYIISFCQTLTSQPNQPTNQQNARNTAPQERRHCPRERDEGLQLWRERARPAEVSSSFFYSIPKAQTQIKPNLFSTIQSSSSAKSPNRIDFKGELPLTNLQIGVVCMSKIKHADETFDQKKLLENFYQLPKSGKYG